MIRRALAAVAGVSALVMGATLLSPAPSPAHAAAPASPSGVPMPGNKGEWRVVFADDFNGNDLDTTSWSTWHGQAKSSPSSWDSSRVMVQGGKLILRAAKKDGEWVTGGVGNGRAGAQRYGKYEIRFRADKGNAFAYAFLLYPMSGGWPPEIDIAEDGGGNREQNMATLHYDADNKQIKRFIDADFSEWHTIGVIWGPDRLQYTLDGEIYGTVAHRGVPDVPMWLGLQSEYKDCSEQYNNCPNRATPAVMDVEIDWVVRYQRVGPNSAPAQRPTPPASRPRRTPPAGAASAGAIPVVVSPTPTRAKARSLHGARIGRYVYVSARPKGRVARVRFYLDDPRRQRSPIHVEAQAPFDLQGGVISRANPFKTQKLSKGRHTLTVVVVRPNGRTQNRTVTFYR